MFGRFDTKGGVLLGDKLLLLFFLFLSIITNNNSLFVRFDTKGGVLLGDKFTSVKKINDVRENCVR